MSARILLADDDVSLRYVLSQALAKEGYAVRATGNVSTLAKWVREGEGDLVLSDVYMGDECVFDALPAMRSARPDLPFVVMSAQSTVATALSATSAGAFDYVPKPFDLDHLMAVLKRALKGEPDAQARARATHAAKEERLAIIGRSPAMQDVYRAIARVAAGELTVLIEGESGTGKERVARAVHENSRRASKAFVRARLAGAGAAFIDNEVFGLGGLVEQAHGGTLFLEGVDELTPDAQTRLAALLHNEDTCGRPRLIAAAQRSLAQLVREGAFRSDLFYQLNVVCIRMPPLRERREDIGDLARALLVRAKREGHAEKTLDAAAVARLQQHDFPGNIRELENLLRRAAALTPAKLITASDVADGLVVPGPVADLAVAQEFGVALARRLSGEFVNGLPPSGLYERILGEIEGPLIQQTLNATHGNQIRAAAILGINRNTLRKKIQALGITTGRGD
ncbi:MAG: sigma-54 dependent transcriptional regulator [Terricaulis sp.]